MKRFIPGLAILLLTLSSCSRFKNEISGALGVLLVILLGLLAMASVFAILRFSRRQVLFSIGVYLFMLPLLLFFGYVIYVTHRFNRAVKESLASGEVSFPYELYFIFFGLIFLVLIYLFFDIVQARKERSQKVEKKGVERELDDSLGL